MKGENEFLTGEARFSAFPEMRQALAEAAVAAARGEVPVGAVLSDGQGQVIAAAGNRVEADLDPTAHAEMLVLAAGRRRLGRKWLAECTLTVTLEPCALCAAAISLHRVGRLVFGAYDPKGGAVDHGPRWFDQPTCLSHPREIIGGVQEQAAGRLLRDFFAGLRT